MDASPAVDTPRKGDPITAEWAAQVAAAANAVPHTPEEPGAFASPFGSVPRPVAQTMLGDRQRPMPFDCIVWNNAGTDKAYIYLPSLSGSQLGQDFVVVDQRAIAMNDKSSLSGPNNGWYCFGAVSADTTHRVGLAFTGQTGSALHGWSVFIKSGSWTPPAWADLSMPIVEIARIEIASTWSATTPYDQSHGVIQFHRGGLVLARQWVRWTNVATAPGLVFKDVNGNDMFSVKQSNGTFSLYGDWDVHGSVDFGPGTLKFGADTYAPGTIVDKNGNSHTVLEKQ